MARKALSDKELEKYLYHSEDEDINFQSSGSDAEYIQPENSSDSEESHYEGTFYFYLKFMNV